jgi:hypothetical protein
MDNQTVFNNLIMDKKPTPVTLFNTDPSKPDVFLTEEGYAHAQHHIDKSMSDISLTEEDYDTLRALSTEESKRYDRRWSDLYDEFFGDMTQVDAAMAEEFPDGPPKQRMHGPIPDKLRAKMELSFRKAIGRLNGSK